MGSIRYILRTQVICQGEEEGKCLHVNIPMQPVRHQFSSDGAL